MCVNWMAGVSDAFSTRAAAYDAALAHAPREFRSKDKTATLLAAPGVGGFIRGLLSSPRSDSGSTTSQSVGAPATPLSSPPGFGGGDPLATSGFMAASAPPSFPPPDTLPHFLVIVDHERDASHGTLWLPLEEVLTCTTWPVAFGDAMAPCSRKGIGVRARVGCWAGIPPPFMTLHPAGRTIEGLKDAFEGRSHSSSLISMSNAGPWGRAWEYAHSGGATPTPHASPAHRVLLLIMTRVSLPMGAPLHERAFPLVVELRALGDTTVQPSVVSMLYPGSTPADIIAASSSPNTLLAVGGGDVVSVLVLVAETPNGLLSLTSGILRVAASTAISARRPLRLRFGRAPGSVTVPLKNIALRVSGESASHATLKVSPWDGVANVRASVAAHLGVPAALLALSTTHDAAVPPSPPLSDAALLGESDGIFDARHPVLFADVLHRGHDASLSDNQSPGRR